MKKEHALDTPFATWKWRLLATLVKLNGCKACRQGGFVLVGRPLDVKFIRYFYAWLVREIDSLAQKECKGSERVYSNNWRIGCSETVASRLRGQQVNSLRQSSKHFLAREAGRKAGHSIRLKLNENL